MVEETALRDAGRGADVVDARARHNRCERTRSIVASTRRTRELSRSGSHALTYQRVWSDHTGWYVATSTAGRPPGAAFQFNAASTASPMRARRQSGPPCSAMSGRARAVVDARIDRRLPRRPPRVRGPSECRSSIATLRIVPMGLAMPLPAMSGRGAVDRLVQPALAVAERRRRQQAERAREHRRLRRSGCRRTCSR